jgi:uncharacterized protein
MPDEPGDLRDPFDDCEWLPARDLFRKLGFAPLPPSALDDFQLRGRLSVAELPIQIDREKIAEFCHARGIRKLSLFGSVLRDDFDPARSDVDVLAEFEPDALKGVGFRYFGYGEALAAIIGRKVDFCSRLNKYIEAAVRREAIPIYERA